MDTDSSHIWVIINSAAVNIGMHVSFQISILIFFGLIPWVKLLHDTDPTTDRVGMLPMNFLCRRQ